MKFLLLCLFLFTLVSFGLAETVAQVAAKERARRETLAKEGIKSRTFTNADVTNLKSTLAMESTGWDDLQQDSNRPVNATSESEQKNKELEQEIQRRRDLIEKTKQEYAEDKQETEVGGAYRTYNIGNRYRVLREKEELIRELEKDVSELEAQKEE